jgi:hypothetical protein
MNKKQSSIKKKNINTININISVYKENGDITDEELVKFNYDFINFIEKRGMFCGGVMKFKKERN